MVDDHPFTSRLVKDTLYAGGAQSVHAAQDGGEAVAMLRGCQPHIVITDWRMPGLDGLDFTRLVRQAALTPDPRIPDPQVPIVLLSAHTSARTVETARRAGVSEVVVKPFTIATLMQRIQAAMTAPRPFVVSTAYVGPDRRRRKGASGDAVRVRRITDRPLAEIPAPEGDSVLKLLQAGIDELGRPRRVPRQGDAQ
ncbi:MAG: response regulator [Caulobacteraceae bacterium]|nr:response regulator [Caulobacteraceae bacterium]